ncbi:hypothetical protein KP509_16G047300 [Ceratopteris richardii]|uniref:poly(ADP-ribose) glycohydrolase n=3 Tax=Ceratopteris richardii TaxID=49495 RepID=A0A8T2T011_CERRI|nr:hypothetical protein KP509_16G047300 [Ceratopteris richardii]
MDESILPFLPLLERTHSGALQWPSHLEFALKSLIAGPSISEVTSPEALYDFINDLREQSQLSLLSPAAMIGFVTYFDDLITRADAKNFFEEVLPSIADLAFRMPVLMNDHFKQSMSVTPKIPLINLRLLKPQYSGLVYISQELVAALLACMFLCLYPRKGRAEARLPDINFDGLFESISIQMPQQEQKVHCILHYFTRVTHCIPKGMLSFERKVLPRGQESLMHCTIRQPNQSFWSESSSSFCPLKVIKDGNIEDHNSNALEVDFANCYLGGGVLRLGCVQEEIRFLISPELIAGMLFMPAMQANESIEIRGAERYSCHTGYSSSFCFAGDYVDTKPRDALGRRRTCIVAIDALMMPGKRQYEDKLMLREVNKAFCGFLDQMEPLLLSISFCYTKEVHQKGSYTDGGCGISDDADRVLVKDEFSTLGIATGNWGCGAFGGDMELKSILQWIAASQAGRPFLTYFSFGVPEGGSLQQVADWIISEGWSVGELWNVLVDYGQRRVSGRLNEGLFKWILPNAAAIQDAQASDTPAEAHYNDLTVFSCIETAEVSHIEDSMAIDSI